MKKFITIGFLVCSLVSFAQYVDEGEDDGIDQNYLEDQFYTAIAYNFLINRPEGVVQRNFSYNLQLGFIKDIPINERRNFGLGLGFGYAANSYYTNLKANEMVDGTVEYEILDESFKRSKFETHAIEFPIEIRWRTSNAIDYRFWRVYAGGKITYAFSRRSKFVSDDQKLSFSNDDIRQWNYGIMLNIGYNTFNLHLYYSINPVLNDNVRLNGEAIEMRPLKIGIIFYIL